MKLETNTIEISLELSGFDIDVSVIYEYVPEVVGVYDKLPEDCYPSEPAEVHILSIEHIEEDDGEITNLGFLLNIMDFTEFLEEIVKEDHEKL